MSINEISRSLGRIEGKLEAIHKSLPDHERRLRSLERWRWLVVGGAAVIAFLLGYARVR